jgi:hypothetical protein
MAQRCQIVDMGYGRLRVGPSMSEIADRHRVAEPRRHAGSSGRAFHLESKPVVRPRVEQSSLRAAPQHLSQSCGFVAESGPNNAEENMMRRLLLAGTVLALAAGVTASAMASDQKADKGGSHVGRFHTAASGKTYHIRRSSRVAGVRGPESSYPGGGSPGYHGGFIDLGPLGITAACGSYPLRYGTCGPGYGTPIDAWSY